MTELPADLRLPVETDHLEAGGRRAHVVEDAGALRVTVDRTTIRIELDPPLVRAATRQWPFAAERDHVRVFAATDQPVVSLERTLAPHSGQRVTVHDARGLTIRIDGEVTGEGTADCGDRVRVTVHASDRPAPDVDALLGGAIARARRRASQRPGLIRPGERHDPIADADHRLRLDIAGAVQLSARERSLAVLALLALNDERVAREVAVAGEVDIAAEPACALVLAGAWSAWRGVALPSDILRLAARAGGPARADGDPWQRAAQALAPLATDVLGGDPEHARPSVAADPATAIIALTGAGTLPRSAGEVLRLIHGELGIMPDAVRGRIRIAPDLGAGSTRIDQIGVADAAFLCHAELADEVATLEVEQTRGAAPFTGILEPRVPGRRLREALVEDTPAELDTTDVEGGIRPRVQVIIDRRRRVVLNFERR